MKLNESIRIRIDEELNNNLIQLARERQEEKSRVARRIIKSFFDENKTIPNV